jgi:HD superfamily phosphodiesterase
MSKINDLLVAESEKYISALLAEKLPENIIFHDLEHAFLLKHYAETIGEHAGLTAEEMNILRICALFHDTGYVNSYENCNEESVAIASAFLAQQGVDKQMISHVAEIIRSGRIPQNPRDKIAEVLCDAEMTYIASDNGIEQFDLLYDETAISKQSPGKRNVFEQKYIAYFNAHTYFTDYGKTILQPKKEAAVIRLSGRLRRRKLVEPKKESPEKKNFVYSRGVDTMFRITARNQINLNSIADNKSNILISVNAIIISIIITMLAGNIGNMSQDIFPILVFLVICLITIIIAILSTRPNIVNSKFTKEDLKNKNVDLTFFGNFIKLNYGEYQDAVKEMMTDDEHLYSTLLKNQYALGKILSKKFRLVRIAYNVFMIGIIFTVIVFLLNYLIMHK